MDGGKGSKLLVTPYRLASGAPLSTPVEGRDAVIVGMNDGELSNENKSPPSHVSVSNGSVFMMPKGELYLLRNVGPIWPFYAYRVVYAVFGLQVFSS
jgi:hypothetical protein